MTTTTTTPTAEKTLYKNTKGKIRITRTLLEVKGTRYPVRNIAKVKLNKSDADVRPLINFIVSACIVAGLGFLFTWQPLIVLGLLTLAFLIFNPLNLDPTYKLTVTTTQGEEIILEPKTTEDMKEMQSALETAIDMMDERLHNV
jgi:Family of unknown function (DUF6232)